ncbi:TrmH family RNA methyltransferase [Adlercreutzia sp. ZJ141]|uniref:TrmH family RNA methyltransferase n=1 Tax=Adlercreutzia sp. ZJ141 TaxID=2709406 RepID=UPI001F14BCC5|nr:RNA methyltransferase [Adlercreutzia sp. ZJ141]
MPVLHVSTLDDPRLDAYARLTEAQLRNKLEPEKGLFIAESGKVIERAFSGGAQPLSLLMEEKWLKSLESLITRMEAHYPTMPVFVAPHDALQELTGFELTRGALGAFRRPALPSVETVVEGARLIAVLENVTNHTNVGAIFRSAAALGVDAVLVTPECYDPLYRRAARVSMGTVFQVPWTRIGCTGHVQHCETDAPKTKHHADGTVNDTDAASQLPALATARTRKRSPLSNKDAHTLGKSAWATSGIPQLKQLGFTTVALALCDNSVSLDDARLATCEKIALVLGTEGDGLAPETIAQCDFTVRIPMAHGVDSLNVAAASAVAFWELRKR